MATQELRVDTPTLKEASSALKTISRGFNDAVDQAEKVMALLGDTSNAPAVHELADAIHKFESKWNDRRKKLKEAIDALAEASFQLASNFESTDEALKTALEPTEDNSQA